MRVDRVDRVDRDGNAGGRVDGGRPLQHRPHGIAEHGSVVAVASLDEGAPSINVAVYFAFYPPGR